MPMDDLYKALDMFSHGVQQYQTSQAVNDASQKLQDMNKQQMDEKQRLIANQQVGSELALRLTGIGASPEHIAAATSGLVPSASTTATNLAQGDMAAKSQAGEITREKMKNQNALDVERLKLSGILGKTSSKDYTDMLTKFEKMPEVTPMLKSIPILQDASQKMHENAGKFGSTAITNLVQMGVVKAAVTRVTDKELKAANESPAAKASLEKELGLQLSGEYPKNVQDFWTKIVDQQLADTQKNLRGHMDSYSRSNPKVDAEALKKGLQYRHNVVNPNQSHIDALKDALAADPTNARAGEVQAKIRQLESN